MKPRSLLPLLACLALVAGCGGDEKKSESGTKAPVDQAFAARMSAHADTSRRLAEVAVEQSRDAGIKRLARQMAAAREDDMNLLRGIQQRLGGVQGGEDPLGVTPEAAGEDLQVESLENAKPFDALWLQAMIRHHQGALELLGAEKKSGQDPATKALADRFAVARIRELDDLTRREQRARG